MVAQERLELSRVLGTPVLRTGAGSSSGVCAVYVTSWSGMPESNRLLSPGKAACDRTHRSRSTYLTMPSFQVAQRHDRPHGAYILSAPLAPFSRELAMAGQGGIEPPRAVLETAALPLRH